jgi:membrane-bound serine protease (ClpP class)
LALVSPWVLAGPLPSAGDRVTVAVVEVRTEITRGLAKYVQRALRDAEARADVVVFDLNTPGGAVDAMSEIVNAIYASKLPKIAYVNTDAISAGAIIALACDQIAMAPGATIGDAAPVSASGEELGEKAIAYVRGKIKATAERNGRNPDIAEAMVDKKKVLVEAEGEVRALTAERYKEMKASGQAVRVLSPEGELLALTTEEALRLRFVELRAETLDALLAGYVLAEDGGARIVLPQGQVALRRRGPSDGDAFRIVGSLEGAEVVRLRRSPLEAMATYVTSTLFGSILLSLGMLGIFVELRTPGFGIPGVVGVLALSLFFGGHMLAEVQSSYGVIAFLIGLALLATELFILPGFGVAGVLGIALMAGGLLFVFGSVTDTAAAPMERLMDALMDFTLAILLTVGLGVVAAIALPRTRLWNRLILHVTETRDEGYLAAPEELAGLVGRTGLALTSLRPSGTAEIDGKRVDVVADGEFIPRNSTVRVLEVEGGRVVVRAADKTA